MSRTSWSLWLLRRAGSEPGHQCFYLSNKFRCQLAKQKHRICPKPHSCKMGAGENCARDNLHTQMGRLSAPSVVFRLCRHFRNQVRSHASGTLRTTQFVHNCVAHDTQMSCSCPVGITNMNHLTNESQPALTQERIRCMTVNHHC